MLNSFEIKSQLRMKCDEIRTIIAESNNEKLSQLCDDFYSKYSAITDQDKIKLVMCGEWSTGKSTIVKALTGIKDIKIGEDVTTTEVHEYKYDDFYIVDTPGFNIFDDSHTNIAKKALMDSDCVIYCITEQQLFSDDSIEDFIRTCKSIRNITPTILTVTKFGSEGNDPFDALFNIRNDIDANLKDHGFEEVPTICIISAERYIRGKETGDEALIEKSYFNNLIQEIEDAGKQLKQGQDQLYKVKCKRQIEFMVDFINQCIEENKKSFNDEDEKKLNEQKKRLSDELIKEKNEIRNEYTNNINKMYDIIHDINDIDDYSTNAEKINNLAESTIKNIMDRSEISIPPELINFNVDTEALNNEKKAFFSKLRKKNKTAKTGLGEKSASLLIDAVGKVNDKAAPVEMIKEEKVFWKITRKRKELSKVGGEGTELAKDLCKINNQKGIVISEKIGKLANIAEKHKSKIKATGVAIDFLKPLLESFISNRHDKKAFHDVFQEKQKDSQEIKNLKINLDKVLEKAYEEKMKKLYLENNKESNDPLGLDTRFNSIRIKIEDIKSQIDQPDTEGDE